MKSNTLEECISVMYSHKDDLLDIAQFMGFNSNHEWDELKAEQIRHNLAMSILDNPKQVLNQLPEEDLLLLQRLKDTEPGTESPILTPTYVTTMAGLGLAEQHGFDIYDDGFIVISEDFKQAIRPHVDEILNNTEVKQRLAIERYLLGALNIYGVMTASELKAVLKESLNLEDDGSGIFEQILSQSLTLKELRYEDFEDLGDDLYISPYVDFFGEILDERKKRKNITSNKHFAPGLLKKAGEAPIPCIPNPLNGMMTDTLVRKLGYSPDDAYFTLYKVWYMIQHEEDSPIKNVNNIIDEVFDMAPNGDDLADIKQTNEVLRVIQDFINHTPRWIFRGHCSKDLFVPLTSAPRISIGPNMMKMGYTQEQVQRMADQAWANRNVGRNDPCPCGSGKKYKNCCGKVF